jgi:hypothetical protein
LPRLGLIAQARSDIGHSPDGGVVEAGLEADGAERGELGRAVLGCTKSKSRTQRTSRQNREEGHVAS